MNKVLHDLVISEFEGYVKRYYQKGINKDVIRSVMKGFIRALELSGNNIQANICKEMCSKLD